MGENSYGRNQIMWNTLSTRAYHDLRTRILDHDMSRVRREVNGLSNGVPDN